jgi:NTE family protein
VIAESDPQRAWSPPEGQQPDRLANQLSPAHYHPHERDTPAPESGVGLCLSGGGYRAMLFHTGALWRLSETGWLRRLTMISSVSGGSITAGVLATRWTQLLGGGGEADKFEQQVVDPIRGLAAQTIDLRAALMGLLLPGGANKRLAGCYRRALFPDSPSLSDLPNEPAFVFNATNLQSGSRWQFSKPAMGDYRVGEVPDPRHPLADVVAASSAFPPYLSPARIRLGEADYAPATPREPAEAKVRGESADARGPADADLRHGPYTTNPVLSDGGVYDNLGLDAPWKHCRTVLISDACPHLKPAPRVRTLWVLQTNRILHVIDNQVRDLRKRQAISGYQLRERSGAYWGIASDISNFKAPHALPCPLEQTLNLAKIRTRLRKLSRDDQMRLINWGYAIADAAIRKHVDPSLSPPSGFPYPTVTV